MQTSTSLNLFILSFFISILLIPVTSLSYTPLSTFSTTSFYSKPHLRPSNLYVLPSLPIHKFHKCATGNFEVNGQFGINVEGIIRNKGDCLSDEQKEKLAKSVDTIEQSLTAASFSLELFSRIQEDEKTKRILEEAALIVKKVNDDVVTNLTRIANEACGSCQDIAMTVDDAFKVIFSAVVDIDPDVKTSPIFDAVVTAANAVVEITEDICKAKTPNEDEDLAKVRYISDEARFREDKKKCLSKEQEADIQEVIQLGANVLNTFAQWFRESEDRVESQQLKEILDKLADFFLKERENMLDNGEEYMEKSCETCSKVAKMIYKLNNMVEKTLNEVFPPWKDVKQFRDFFASVDEILKELKQTCPFDYDTLKLNMFERTQLFPSIKELSNYELEFLNAISNIDIRGFNFQINEDEFAKDRNMACNCSDLVSKLLKRLDEVEDYLNKEYPSWKESEILVRLDEALRDLIKKIGARCPNATSLVARFDAIFQTPGHFQCLTDKEIRNLNSLVKGFTFGIDILINELKNLEKIVQVQEISDPIEKSVKFIQDIKQEFQDKVFQNSENLCESCEQFVEDLDQGLKRLKEKLDEDFPNWRNYEVLDRIMSLIKVFIAKIDEMCPNKKSQPDDNQFDCLSLTEQKDVQNIVDFFDEVLEKTSELAKKLSTKVDNPNVEEYLKKFAKYLDDERGDLDKNFEKNLEDLCETCSKVSGQIFQIVNKIETTLNEVFPIWRDFEQVKDIFDQIDMVLKILQDLCPYQFHRSSVSFFNPFRCRNNAELLSLGFQINTALAKIPELNDVQLRMNSDKSLCLSCVDIVQSVEDFISKIESYLSQNIPEWKELPLLVELDNMLHTLLDNIYQECPKSSIWIQHQQLSMTRNQMKCLSDEEKERFLDGLKMVEDVLDEAKAELKSMAASTDNKEIKHLLKDLIKYTSKIEVEVDQRSKSIAEELCVNCAEYTKAVKEKVDDVISYLDENYPSWRKSNVLSAFAEQTEIMLVFLHEFCPNHPRITYISPELQVQAHMVNRINVEDASCLTPEEDENVKYYVSKLQVLFDYAAEVLKIYADEISDDYYDEKHELELASKILASLAKNLLSNFTKIADESCGTCLDLVKAAKDFEALLEKTMNDVDNEWRTKQTFKEVLIAVNTLIEFVETMCPQQMPTKLYKNMKYEQALMGAILSSKLRLLKFVQTVNKLFLVNEAMMATLNNDIDSYAKDLSRTVDAYEVLVKLEGSQRLFAIVLKAYGVTDLQGRMYKEFSMTSAKPEVLDLKNIRLSKKQLDLLEVVSHLLQSTFGTLSDTLEILQSVNGIGSNEQQMIAALQTVLQNFYERTKTIAYNAAQTKHFNCEFLAKAISDVASEMQEILYKVENDGKWSERSKRLAHAVLTAFEATWKIIYDLCPQGLNQLKTTIPSTSKPMFRKVLA